MLELSKYTPVFMLSFVASTSLASTRPNVILVIADDLGYGDLGIYGHPSVDTPNLDALANSGLRLTNYYAASAVCSPSRAAMLTGRHPSRTGITTYLMEGSNEYLNSDELTVAEILRDSGYQTALIGKWHLSSDLTSEDQAQPNDQGFEYFYGHNGYQIPTNLNPTNIVRNRSALGTQQGYTAELYANEAIRWINQRDPDKPFFLILSMAEPHTTFENPPEYNRLYSEYTSGTIVPIRSGASAPQANQLQARGPGEYYANVTYMDAQIGRLLGHLKVLKVHDDTVVMFTSDNGPVTSDWTSWWEVNAYGSTGGLRGRKNTLYEGGIKVPTIIYYPGVTKPSSVSDEFVLGMDLFTTIVRIAGGSAPLDRPIDGIDISDIFQGGHLAPRLAVWTLKSTHLDFVYAVRYDDWKLLLASDNSPKALFNLDQDPLELFNRIASDQLRVSELTQLFTEAMQSITADRETFHVLR